MTFNPSVPNAGQSPGLFPAQNSDNFTRLKTIINADHVFNDTAQTTDGVHRQMTMVARALPVSLPAGTNSMLFTFLDALSRAQLAYYDGVTIVQLTPPGEIYPIRIVVPITLAASASGVVYADPGFNWAGTGYALYQGTNSLNFYDIVRSGGNDRHVLDNNGGISSPTLSFSGNNVLITNNSGSSKVCVASLIINRIV